MANLAVRERAPMTHPSVPSFAHPDEVFAELDGQPIALGDVYATIEVHAVHDAAGWRWIQASLQGNQPHMITLRLPEGENAQRAYLSLSSWIANPQHPLPEVIATA
jgi:hypothetical protein